MQPSMIVQICNLSEGPAAIYADIGTIVGVYSLVISQISLLREALLTIATNILLICRVVTNMIQ